jgi:hypothetical protein
MAFKEVSSFIRFLSMGALGTRRAIQVLKECGHKPIELERYCSSNKIWATKIKRLRLPDLICTHCGQRFEVRGKSKLEIKMSDSPNNPDRQWDSGLNDEDKAIFLTIHQSNAELIPASKVNAFLIRDLRAVINASKLGPPKSASEGAERDRTWPSWVPPKSGKVSRITADDAGIALKLSYDDGSQYTYRSQTKNVHLSIGDSFPAFERIAASIIPSVASLQCPGSTWEPCIDPQADARDVYASLKVFSAEPRDCDVSRLRELLEHEDYRIRLEATHALAARRDPDALNQLKKVALLSGDDAPWAMEAVLILTELPRSISEEILKNVVTQAPHSEVRSAAVWGLGVIGCEISALVPMFQDKDPDVVNHAIVAASRRLLTPSDTQLMIRSLNGPATPAAAACEVLSRAVSPDIQQLLIAANHGGTKSLWVLACLSRMAPATVRASEEWARLSEELKTAIERLWFWRENSRFSDPESAADLEILNKQLFPI